MNDEPAMRRSRIVRRVELDPPRELLTPHDAWPAMPPAASAWILQRPADRPFGSDQPFRLELLAADGRELISFSFATLEQCLVGGSRHAAVAPDEWRVVSEPFGDAPVIGADLLGQVAQIPTTEDHGVENRPGRVRLRDGSWRDAVYLLDLEAYLDEFGCAPGSSRRAYELDFGAVVEVADSRTRLPPEIAQALYEAGESAMGGCFFTLVTTRGRRIPCATGNWVDFIEYPAGVGPDDIVAVEPHAEDARRASHPARLPDTKWSVYRLPDPA